MFIPIIMAGGSGTRLWPLSRKLFPKQYLALNGEFSMLQETVRRLNGLDCQDPVLVCRGTPVSGCRADAPDGRTIRQ